MNVRVERGGWKGSRADGRGRLAEERAHQKEHSRDFQAQYSQSGQEPRGLLVL